MTQVWVLRAASVGTVALALLTLACQWPGSPALAVALALAVLFWHAPVVAGLLLTATIVNSQRAGPGAPAPRWSALPHAWWLESVAVWRIFFWRQPWRVNALPDQLPANGADPSRRGVLLVHGFFCNRAMWREWQLDLMRAGHSVVAINLQPLFGDIDTYAATVDAGVRQLQAATGQAPLIVGHSMGGLATRAWLRACAADAEGDHRAHAVVTLGTPHAGTLLAALLPRLARPWNAGQMQASSEWLVELGRAEPAERRARFHCWFSNGDTIVMPTLTGSLTGGHAHFVPEMGHMQLAVDAEIRAAALRAAG